LQLGGLSTNTNGGGAVAPNSGSDFIGNTAPDADRRGHQHGRRHIQQTNCDLRVGSFAANVPDFIRQPQLRSGRDQRSCGRPHGHRLNRTVTVHPGHGQHHPGSAADNANGRSSSTPRAPSPDPAAAHRRDRRQLAVARDEQRVELAGPRRHRLGRHAPVRERNTFNATAPRLITVNFTNPAGTGQPGGPDSIVLDQLAGSLFITNITAGQNITATSRVGSILTTPTGR
jgi:hypothetical protein